MLLISGAAFSQDAEALVKRVRTRLEMVNDYTADGMLKTDVPFIRIPESKVIVYYKKPNKFRIKKEDGISVVPKGGVSINLNSLFDGGYSVIPAGTSVINGIKVLVVKLLPLKEDNEVVLSTLYIDEEDALIPRASTTTRSSGTYEMEMIYGKFAKWALPDKVLFSFNTKDYKLPKGVTFEYETTEKPQKPPDGKNQKGKVEITYENYSINKGVKDAVFSTGK